MKWFRKVSFKRVLLTSVLPMIIRILIVGAQVSVTPTAPPTASNALTTVLGYLQWLGVVGGVGVGALIAGIKIAMMHDMEGGKRDLMFSIIGGVIISLVATVLNLFI
ncbi:hypothetical protein [Saccharolobus islandicus]|uniref:Uncharacterized protein n=1 Tax=Saccharolobus islandicus (strain M.16.4 / Kamchatka \|nr:hypothetical protein [Sulfolobus islandicus]ACR42240.1 hypothetical protein M164_1637 [Sulfolobus islandicus M.16.4]